MARVVRLPIPPAMLFTILIVTMLLMVAYLIAPSEVKLPMMVCLGLMMMLIAFTNVELTIYLVIMSTLLSPEIDLTHGSSAEGTTSSRGVTVRMDDLLLTLVCLTWLFRMAVSKQLNLVRRTPINQPILWYWGATLLATTVGFYAGYVKSMYGFFFVLKYLEYFVLYYVIVNDIRDKPTLRRYIMVMMFTCFIASLVGIAQIPGGGRVSAPFEGQEGEPNTFGGYLVLMFSVALGMFFEEEDGRMRRRWLMLLPFILLPLVYTQSRSSYLAFVVMTAAFIVFSAKKKLLITACIVGVALAPFLAPKAIVERVEFTFTQKQESGQIKVGSLHVDTSTSDRLEQWKRALTVLFPSRPIIGRGVTGAGFMDAQLARVLSETGLIGLFTFLWLLWRIFKVFLQGSREIKDGRMRGAALGGLCGFLGLQAHAIGTNTFIIVRIMEPLMILLGLVMAALLVQREEMARSATSMEVPAHE